MKTFFRGLMACYLILASHHAFADTLSPAVTCDVYEGKLNKHFTLSGVLENNASLPGHLFLPTYAVQSFSGALLDVHMDTTNGKRHLMLNLRPLGSPWPSASGDFNTGISFYGTNSDGLSTVFWCDCKSVN